MTALRMSWSVVVLLVVYSLDVISHAGASPVSSSTAMHDEIDQSPKRHTEIDKHPDSPLVAKGNGDPDEMTGRGKRDLFGGNNNGGGGLMFGGNNSGGGGLMFGGNYMAGSNNGDAFGGGNSQHGNNNNSNQPANNFSMSEFMQFVFQMMQIRMFMGIINRMNPADDAPRAPDSVSTSAKTTAKKV